MKTQWIACFYLALPCLQAQDTLKSVVVDSYFKNVRQFLETSAEAMPSDKYNFRPTPSQFTFGQWIDHSTERNYLDCSTLRSEPNPMPKPKVDMLTQKDEIVKALKDSFNYCASTFDTLNDQKILSSSQLTTSFLHTVVHNNEIYGNVVNYLRLSGITPPSTELMQRMMKGKKK